MRPKQFFVSALLCLSIFPVQAANYIKSGNTVTVKLQQTVADAPQQVRLQVVNDKIIRVQATPESQFPAKQSLIIVPQKNKTRYTVSEEGSNIVVKTASVRAVVDGQTGRIEFFDASGNKLLAETQQKGKTFKRFIVPEREIGADSHLTNEQKQGWTWHAQFDSPADEAFYGLGQHQAEDLNMKGLNEDLFQYNTKVSVPFVLSNKGYGILWDSYSYCRFGNPNDYQQLHRAFKLFRSIHVNWVLTHYPKDSNSRVLM